MLFFFGFHRGFRGNPDEDHGSQRAGHFDPMTTGEEFPDAADGRQFSWWNLLHQSIHLERTWNDQVSFPPFVPDFFRDGGNPRKILDVLEFLLPASLSYFHRVPFQSICICFDPDSHALQVFNGSWRVQRMGHHLQTRRDRTFKVLEQAADHRGGGEKIGILMVQAE